MEYIVGLAVIAALYFIFFRTKEETVVEAKPEAAPYKVEVVNAQPIVEVAPVAEVKPAPVAKKTPAKKPAAVKKAPAKAPAAKKTPAKKPAAKTTKPKA